MIRRQQRIERIAAVAREYLAAKSAADLLMTQLQADPNYGRTRGWESRDGTAFDESVNATYIIRLYAEFEAGLRDYWANHLNRATHPPMAHLLKSVADQRIAIDRFEDADAVRQYRNFLVHDDSSNAPPDDLRAFSVTDAKKHLCYFFGRLDPDW
ncbi:MAG: hypothetical protein KDA62_12325 [Planctomycetales bacterium]|nr:hypothetical protein [Planctomycetales bacterium]MCA9163765.1 hypothetical protein [Planctomycetales bacterium]